MRQVVALLVFGIAAILGSAHAQETGDFVGNQSALTIARHVRWSDFDSDFADWPASDDGNALDLAMSRSNERWLSDRFGSSLYGYVVRGQNDVGSSGGGAGASSAVDPSVPLTQMGFQNVFVPSTYDASGYSNIFNLQPVLPIHLNSDFFPYHIVRPTLPIIAPTADPDGPLGVQGGLGDLVLLDVYTHPIENLKTNVGVGYVGILPTSTHPQLGLSEWQFGPAAFFVTTAIPKWVIGAIYEQPFSLESNAYSVQVQPIATRLLPNEWYIGWGDRVLLLNDQDGNHNLALNFKVGKVVTLGKQPLNIFVEPSYTPEGLRKGSADEWGIKLNVTFLFPKTKLGPLFGSECRCR